MTVAAIFDCDGVLIDSAHVWRDTEGELCRRAGRPLTEEEQRAIVTMTIGEVGDFLHSRIGLGEDGAHVVRMIDELMMDFYANRACAVRGVEHLLRSLHDRGVVMSVVSSSPKPYLMAGLARIGVDDVFQAILSVEDLDTSKRDPLIFRHAMDLMGSTPHDTWGFDDSYYAVQTMRDLGICTVGVYDAHEPYELDRLREASDLLTCDYGDLDPDMIAAGPAAWKGR
ncbi:MAG: HAD family hydrolase [Eggerthellaceae bacterium]